MGSLSVCHIFFFSKDVYFCPIDFAYSDSIFRGILLCASKHDFGRVINIDIELFDNLIRIIFSYKTDITYMPRPSYYSTEVLTIP